MSLGAEVFGGHVNTLNWVWDVNTLLAVLETQPGGSSSSGVVVDGVDPTIKATVFDYTNSNPLGVVLRDTNGDYVSVGGGTQYTEDVPAAADPVGTALNLIRADTPAAVTSTDGDNVAARGTNKGEVYVKHLDSIAVTATNLDVALSTRLKAADTLAAVTTVGTVTTITNAVTTSPPANASTNVAQLAGTTTSVSSGVKDAGTLRVVLATDQPALTNKLLVTPDSVALPANQSVNVNQLAGTATAVNSGVKDNGTLRVVLATDQPALTNKLLVTPDSVALPANQSVNVSQIAAGTTATVATGVQKVGVADSAGTAIPSATATPAAGAVGLNVRVANDQRLGTVGVISILNSVLSGTATANSAVEVILDGNGADGVFYIPTTSTLVGTLVGQYTIDGSVWFTSIILENTTGSRKVITVTAASGTAYVIEVLAPASATKVRLTCAAFTSGTTGNIRGYSSQYTGPFAVGTLSAQREGDSVSLFTSAGYPNLGGGQDSGALARMFRVFNAAPASSDYGLIVRDVNIPANAALADTFSNPTTSHWGSDNHLFNGTTWDRQRGTFNTTTGDTGAKATAAFLGATQTNFNARGAIVTCLLGTVTGAVTTWQTGIQWSFDGGTTWLELTPLGANDTAAASGRTYTWIIYPTNTSQAAGTTPATLVPGTISVAGPTQLNVINAALPRTWRFAAQVSVATSIVITSVSVNYLL